VCYVGCPDGYEPDRKNQIECVKIQWGKIYDEPKLAVVAKKSEDPLSEMATCKDYFSQKTLVYFPMLIFQLTICILVFCSWLYDKKTHRTHSLVALSAPVYTFAVLLQMFLGWTFEGGKGFECSVPGDDGKLDKQTYSAFVGWVTFVILLILIGLNVAFFIYINFSRKLKYDDLWQQWKDKDSRRIHYRLVLGFSTGVSLLLSNLMISNFLGRKRYNAQFDSK